MKIFKTAIFCSITSLVLMTACTTSQPRNDMVRTTTTSSSSTYSSSESRMGNVSNIQTLATSSRTSGGGAILGAIIGGAVGSQIGGGSGRTAATVVGVVGGAVAGNAIERRTKRDDEFYRVSVRFDNGSTAQFDYDNINDLREGDRVQVRNGQVERI